MKRRHSTYPTRNLDEAAQSWRKRPYRAIKVGCLYPQSVVVRPNRVCYKVNTRLVLPKPLEVSRLRICAGKAGGTSRNEGVCFV